MNSTLSLKRVFSILSDAGLVFLLVLLGKIAATSQITSSPLALMLWCGLLTPVAMILQSRLFGRSFGEWLTGLRRVQKGTRRRPARIYDWLFDAETLEDRERALPLGVQLLASLAMLFLGASILFYGAAQDPHLRRLKERVLPLFAPAAESPAWRVTPWYYASGAWPIQFGGQPILYSLPYERGPPQRFVGKIQSYWGKSGVRVTIVGPLTLRGTGSRAELRECFTRMFGCTSLRQEVFQRPLAPFTSQVPKMDKAQWITVDNPLLDEDDRPEGIYVSGKARNGETIEGYFLINSRMTFQGFLLYRYETEEGVAASQMLAKALGSFRMTTDLKAATAWVNQSLSKTDLRRQVGDEKLLHAQGLLLSKVSVDPVSFDPFYYLAGTAFLLFQSAEERRDLEAASAAKSMIVSSHRFATDIAPTDPRMKELDLFKARVEKF